MNKNNRRYIFSFLLILLFQTSLKAQSISISNQVYGIEQEIWKTFDERQKKAVMSLYKRDVQNLEHQEKKKKRLKKKNQHLKLENHKLAEEIEEAKRVIDAQPTELEHILATLRHIFNDKAPYELNPSYPKISWVQHSPDTLIELDNGAKFQISFLDELKTDIWMKGQRVKVSGSDNIYYSALITNLDTGNSVYGHIKN